MGNILERLHRMDTRKIQIINKLVIDVYAADIVKEIYRMKLSGMSQTAIANALNKQGVLSPRNTSTVLE